MNIGSLKYTFCALLLVVLLASCEQDLDLSMIEVDRSIVVNSIFNNEEALLIDLSYSRSVLERHKDFEKIEDAKVYVGEVGHSDWSLMLHQGNGIYSLDDFIASAGVSYGIEIEMPDGKKIFAESILPKQAQVELVKTAFVDGLQGSALQVNFDIIDQDEEENYYIWDIITPNYEDDPFSLGGDETYRDYLYNFGENSDPISQRNRGQSKIYSNDSRANEGGVLPASFITYQDLTIGQDNSNLPDTTNVDQEELEDVLPSDIPVTLRVLTVSKELYEYYRSIELYYQNGASNSSITNPTEIYSNISCGRGIFAGYSETHIPLN